MSSAWDKLSEDQKAALENEYRELQKWDIEQREARKNELKHKGEWLEYGLDTNQEKFSDIIAERNRRFKEIQKKYGFI